MRVLIRLPRLKDRADYDRCWTESVDPIGITTEPDLSASIVLPLCNTNCDRVEDSLSPAVRDDRRGSSVSPEPEELVTTLETRNRRGPPVASLSQGPQSSPDVQNPTNVSPSQGLEPDASTDKSPEPTAGMSVKDGLKVTGRSFRTLGKRAVDIADVNPVHVALGLVKAIIEVYNVVKKNKEEVAHQIAVIGGRLEEVKKVLDNWKPENEDAFTEILDHFNTTLKDELQGLEKMRDGSNVRKFLDHEDEQERIKAIFSRIDEATEQFQLALGLRSFKVVHGVDQAVRVMGRTVETIKDDKLAKDIRSWLSPPDSSKNYHEAEKKRHPDTCAWVLEDQRFLDWTTNPGFLWIKGDSGSGKSILCSSIINKLPPNIPSLGIAYFFFDARDSQNALQLHENLIRSLISQFSHQRGGIPTELADLYKRCGDHHQPSINQLQDVLHSILGGFSRTYIVIDALDECANREETVTWVEKLVSDPDWKVEGLHITVASRPAVDIEEVFKALDPHPIVVGDATTRQDIMEYLKVQINSNFKMCDEGTREKIESALRERAAGSFRWVALQLAELEKCSSPDEITKKLAELPKDLEDIYKRILNNIDKDHRDHVRTFLQWLAFAKRAMTTAEIAETITVDFASEDGPVFNSTKRYFDPRHVLGRCSSLVSESAGIIKLSHFSVKEYLLSERIEKDFSISEKAAHAKISEISVTYLLQFDSFEPLTEAMLSSWPLAQYAATYWIDHAKSGGIDSALLKSILRLFMSEAAAFTNWIRLHNIDVPWKEQDLSMEKAEVHSALYYASLAGLQQVTECLLKKGADVNAQGGIYGNALEAASYRGHEAIVKLLLDKEADVNAQGGECGNALQAASSWGHEAIVKLLLENEADVNAQGGEYGNALQAASYLGREAIVKLLLDKEADVNAKGGRYGSALIAASYRGHETIVKLLLDKEADVDAEAEIYGSALVAASYLGHEAIVKLLLDKQADVNARGGLHGSALQAASYRGHHAIIKLLLDKEADVDAEGGLYGNALQAASYQGHHAIVKLLLDKEADVNAKGGSYGSALIAASYLGHEAIVKLLLDKEADVSAKGWEYGNALIAASYGGHEAIVKLLLDKEADVNAQGGEYGNALQAASYLGREAIIKLLLDKEADVNAQGGEYGNALQAASYLGREAIVKLLLDKEADVNAQGGLYGSALQAASYLGHEAIVKLLLDKEADVNAQGGLFGSALQAASSEGHDAIVKLLLDRGAVA